MAVFTKVSPKEARALLQRLQLGELRQLRGIEGGIENTNYFLTTESGEFVLTLFERLSAEQAALLQSELAYQNHIAASSAYTALPRGPVHADLFRDNVMFEGEQLSGFFDFYFAGIDSFLFDLAVCLNDWCIDWESGAHDAPRCEAMLAAYQAVRPLTAAERSLLPAMARAGALRFWISRLWDYYLPREAQVLTPHDPRHFERVLRQRIAQPVQVTDNL